MNKTAPFPVAMLLCLAALFLFAACTPEEPAVSSAPPPPSEPSAAAEPESASSESQLPAYEEMEDLLSGDEVYEKLEDFLPLAQIELYNNARFLYLENMGPGWITTEDAAPVIGFPYGNNDAPTLERDGIYYYLLEGQLPTLEALDAHFYSLFTPALADELMGVGTPFVRYIEEDGQLYGTYGDRGTHIDWADLPDLYGPPTSSFGEDGQERLEFTVIGQYEDRESGEAYTEGYPIEMVLTEDGWRVSVFNITY